MGQGVPEEVAQVKGSHTGRFLGPLLKPKATTKAKHQESGIQDHQDGEENRQEVTPKEGQSMSDIQLTVIIPPPAGRSLRW